MKREILIIASYLIASLLLYITKSSLLMYIIIYVLLFTVSQAVRKIY